MQSSWWILLFSRWWLVRMWISSYVLFCNNIYCWTYRHLCIHKWRSISEDPSKTGWSRPESPSRTGWWSLSTILLRLQQPVLTNTGYTKGCCICKFPDYILFLRSMIRLLWLVSGYNADYESTYHTGHTGGQTRLCPLEAMMLSSWNQVLLLWIQVQLSWLSRLTREGSQWRCRLPWVGSYRRRGEGSRSIAKSAKTYGQPRFSRQFSIRTASLVPQVVIPTQFDTCKQALVTAT